MDVPPGAVTVNLHTPEETAQMRTYVSIAVAVTLFVAALFGAEVGQYWP